MIVTFKYNPHKLKQMNAQNPNNEIVWLNPNDFYDTECILETDTGNQNKLDQDHIDELVSLGEEKFLAHILNQKSIKYQYHNGKLIANNGNHRIYAASILGIQQIPAIEDNALTPDPNIKLIHIKDWDLLPKNEYNLYMKSLENNSQDNSSALFDLFKDFGHEI